MVSGSRTRDGANHPIHHWQAMEECLAQDPRFLRDERGRRPVYGGTERFQPDPHWRDHLLFYEYFHGDNGAGLGASHQTGWTGVVAKAIQLYGLLDPQRVLEVGRSAAFKKTQTDSGREAGTRDAERITGDPGGRR